MKKKPKPKKPRKLEKPTTISLKQAAARLSRKGVAKKKELYTPEERSAQARRAVSCRKDRQKSSCWFGLLQFPETYETQGTTRDALFLCDLLQQDLHLYVSFWSQDKLEVRAEALKLPFGRMHEIVEVAFDPHKFRIIRKFELDADRSLRAVQTVLGSEGGQQ